MSDPRSYPNQGVAIPSGAGPAATPLSDERDDSKDQDILKEAQERFAGCEDGWSIPKTEFLDDITFGRLAEQWSPQDIQQRRLDGRPALTNNRLPPFIRQVVNDGRQNRPAIKVRPNGGGSDLPTADVIGGLVKHIEQISDADVAYDTALDNACTGGFGFITVDTEYTHDDSFDLEIKIGAVPNPLAVSWDWQSTAQDSSDWRFAFINELVDKKEFEKRWPKAKSSLTGFDADQYLQTWFVNDQVQVSRYYERVEVPRQIIKLSNGLVIDKESLDDPMLQAIWEGQGVTPVAERTVRSMKIVRRLITGMDILEERSWRGTIIPIIPVYGDAFSVEGRRYSRSLIHDAKDAQRIYNISRTTATEIVALSPKNPFIGEQGAFDGDMDKWANINTKVWPYIEYKKGLQRPQREPVAQVPASAINEANMALDDMKQIVGIHDAGLGMPGNEISGVAIKNRQKEGDVSTFHFVDNLNRSIRCVGRVVLEMIPIVYTGERVVRILGEDGKPKDVQLGPKPPQPPMPMPQIASGQMAPGSPPGMTPPPMQPQGAPPGPMPAPMGMPPAPPPLPAVMQGIERVYDLTVGKYDLTVEAGPSYTTRREEAADNITAFVQAYPPAAPILGPMLAQMSDWPEHEKVSEMLATLMPPAAKAIFTGQPAPPPGPPPELAAKQAEMQAQMAMQQQQAQHEAQLENQKAQQQTQINQQKAQQDFQLAQQAQQHRLQIEQTQAQADIVVMQQKAAAEMQIERERAGLQAQLKREEAQLAAQLKMIGASQSVVPQATEATLQQ